MAEETVFVAVLRDLKHQISELEVTDPRLELLKKRLFDLSVEVEAINERVRRLEHHQDTGLTIARAVALAAFVVLVVLISRYI